jgi:C1A family cysteine protease
MEFLYRKAGKMQPELSRLFCYYATRVWVEGTATDDDSGAQIRDVMKAVARYGVAPEKVWPYVPERFSKRPSSLATSTALQHQVTQYLAVNGLLATRTCLAAGYPIVIGFSVPENMESQACEATGLVRMPEPDEQIVGGHAVLAVGYDDTKKLLMFQNSWGASWGQHGYGFLPYGFVEQGLADDFWTIRNEEL